MGADLSADITTGLSDAALSARASGHVLVYTRVKDPMVACQANGVHQLFETSMWDLGQHTYSSGYSVWGGQIVPRLQFEVHLSWIAGFGLLSFGGSFLGCAVRRLACQTCLRETRLVKLQLVSGWSHGSVALSCSCCIHQ